MHIFSIKETADFFKIVNLSKNRAAVENAVESKNEEPSDVLISCEVKCEPDVSDNERAVIDREDATTNTYNYVETTSVLVNRIKNSRNIDRLSRDSRISVDYAPSTSNMPVTPRIDSETAQIEMGIYEESPRDATTIKMEEDKDYESSIESEITVLNETNFKSKIEDQPRKRSHESDELPNKKQKIDPEALYVSNMTTKGR